MARKRFEYVGIEETVMDCVRQFQTAFTAEEGDSITYTQVMRAGLVHLGIVHSIDVCDGMPEGENEELETA